VTLAGTVATLVLLLDKLTTVPPDGAGPLSLTVPCESSPPLTLVGLSVSEERVTAPAGVTLSDACRETPPAVPVITAVVVAVTVCVVTLNVLLVAPAGTVTLLGTVATLLLLLSDTTTPPEGAAPDRVAVPVDKLPPVTLVGFSVRDERELVEGLPHTLGVPPPPHVCGAAHVPQLSVPPQPSEIEPQFLPCAAHVVGVHGRVQVLFVQTWPLGQAPQLSVPPQPLPIEPQLPVMHTAGTQAAVT